MKVKDKNYYIKQGYRVNPVSTYDENSNKNYWTDERIESSKVFQYHVYEYARKLFLERNFTSAVDIGCGPGIKMRDFFSSISDEITIMDQPSTEPIAKRIFPKAEFIPANLENDNIQISKKFDLILCIDVIEHLEDPDKLIRLMKELMHKDSLCIISTPDRDVRRGINCNHSPNKQHVREWNKDELKNYLSSHDLHIHQHFNFPMKKLNFLEFSISRMFSQLYKSIKWSACQVAVLNRFA